MGAIGFAMLFAQQGMPLIQNYAPEAYSNDAYATSPQNWGIAQDNRGVLFFANSNNIQAFDGTNWRRVQGTDNLLFLKLASDQEGRVFTGGIGELGYIDANKRGELFYHSLLDQLPDSLRQFRKVVNVVADGAGAVYFMDSKQLFRWKAGSFLNWKSKTDWQKAFVAQGRVFVQQTDNGLWYFEKGELRKLPNSDLANPFRVKWLKFLDTGKEPTLERFLTNENGLFSVSADGLQPISSPLDRTLNWNICALNEDQMVVATSNRGAFVIDRDGNVKRVLDSKSGIQDDHVIFPFQDRDGHIWLALNSGITSVNNPNELSVWNKENGLKGAVYCMARFRGKLYLGTSLGCFVLDADEGKAGQLQLRALPKLNGEINGFAIYGEGMLIASGESGITDFKNGESTTIFDYPGVTIFQSIAFPKRYYIGLANGIASIQNENGKWIDQGKLESVAHQVYYISEDDDGDIWASMFDVSWIEMKDGLVQRVTKLDSTNGLLTEMGEIEIQRIGEKLYFCTQIGIYTFDKASKQLLPSNDFGTQFNAKGNSAYMLRKGADETTWIYANSDLGRIKNNGDPDADWDIQPFAQAQISEVWSVFADEDSSFWAASASEVFRYDPNEAEVARVPYAAMISKVTLNDSAVVFYGHHKDEDGYLSLVQPHPLVLPFDSNDVEFSFVALTYVGSDKTQFRYKLDGRDDEWSQWSLRTTKAFTDLYEGQYDFRLQARNISGQLSEMASFKFKILPPWYRTSLAYFVWALLALMLIGLVIFYNNRRIRSQEKVRREKELAQERAMLEATVEGQENERKRIAADLHDGIQANLAAVKLRLALVKKQLAKRGIEEDFTSDPIEMVGDSIMSVRRISHDLMPASLERSGLPGALKELCKRMHTEEGPDVVFVQEGEAANIPQKIGLAVFRVVQELFANALKHAEAKQIEVKLQFAPQKLSLSFKDDGKGFDLAQLQKDGGLGLKNIESRMQLVGGSVAVESAPEKGAQFLLEVTAAEIK